MNKLFVSTMLLGICLSNYNTFAQSKPKAATKHTHNAPVSTAPATVAQPSASTPQLPLPKEDDYYKLVSIPTPENVILEGGGVVALPNGKVAVSTRRGEIWMIDNAYLREGSKPVFKRFASGLMEPLGIAYKDGSYFVAQRGELTKIADTDGDGVADKFENIYTVPTSGHYHEYAFGPVIAPDGNMYVSLNVSFHNIEWWRAESLAKWRGWMVKISPDGKAEPFAAGLRSPAGLGINNEGDIFYTDNQGDWMGSGHITHLEKGNFVGNPAGLVWTSLPESPLKLKFSDIKSTGNPLFEVAKSIPETKVPAVWLPHGILGTSNSEIKVNNTKGRFGPFEGQYFIGDQGQSKVMRVFMEKINGRYQGAAFAFREGFASGVLRLDWGTDGSLFAAQTNRGWSSTGPAPYALQRLVWTGKTPFEMKAVRAQPDGFEIEFTEPVDTKTAAALSSYKVTSFTYQHHSKYGSPVTNSKENLVKGIKVSADGLKVRVVVDSLRQWYVHELKAEGIRSKSNNLPLLHDVAYYTLNNIPTGKPLDNSELTASLLTKPVAMDHSHHTMPMPAATKTAAPKATTASAKRVVEAPASWTNGPDQTISLSTKPGLKFDLEKIEVQAGSKVKLTFNNHDDMLHNFVLVKPGAANKIGDLALKMGLNGSKMNYIPNSDDVLYHTNMLQPDSEETIYFEAPTQSGEYMYLCTLPGHSAVMRGIFIVK